MAGAQVLASNPPPSASKCSLRTLSTGAPTTQLMFPPFPGTGQQGPLLGPQPTMQAPSRGHREPHATAPHRMLHALSPSDQGGHLPGHLGFQVLGQYTWVPLGWGPLFQVQWLHGGLAWAHLPACPLRGSPIGTLKPQPPAIRNKHGQSLNAAPHPTYHAWSCLEKLCMPLCSIHCFHISPEVPTTVTALASGTLIHVQTSRLCPDTVWSGENLVQQQRLRCPCSTEFSVSHHRTLHQV